jgi:hypothetical protein
LGSDYPFDVCDSDPVATVSRIQSISLQEKRRYGENAARLLGFLLPKGRLKSGVRAEEKVPRSAERVRGHFIAEKPKGG